MPGQAIDFVGAQAQIAAWLAGVSGAEAAVALRPLGWERAQSAGRSAEALRVQAAYLCRAEGLPDPEGEALLARLYGAALGLFEEVGPVPPADPLWRTLGLPPAPALRLSLTVEIRPEPIPAPLATSVQLGTRPLSPLGGTVVHAERAVAGAMVRPLSDPRAVRTDKQGRFRLSHWTGEPLVVRKGAVEARVRPDPDASEILIDLKTEI